MKNNPIDITIAYGDGVGPEIMNATLQILKAAEANLTFHEIEVGEKVYLRGHPTGIEPKSWEIVRKTKAFLKAPITTPQGGGFRSLNVTIRAALGLYANIRPCIAYAPYVETKHPAMDMVIVRENEEDLYAGIEYRPTEESYNALKVITVEGCEKIVRYAFEYAKAHGRKKVTCFTKDNILKMSDGIFHKTFDTISKEYPDIVAEHWIIDIGAAKMADTPENFDVIVTPNLYGDILSDVAAQIAGSVGLAGSANIGKNFAMFEAIHGSAPRRAGQNLANPSGLLLGAVMMLAHLGETKTAALIHNAWLKTLEDGIHTYDIYDEATSKQKVGTKEFANAVCERLGQEPTALKKAEYGQLFTTKNREKSLQKAAKKLVGIDIYIEETKPIIEVASRLLAVDPSVELKMITSRGCTVWPTEHPESTICELLRIRFMAKGSLSQELALQLPAKIAAKEMQVTGSQMLYTYNEIPGFSLSPEEQ
jgi:isocitrate dehydrogenase